MHLYRGSRAKVDKIRAQEVHPKDHHKFRPNEAPDKVIWASRSRTWAEIFAVFSGRIGFKLEAITHNPQDGPKEEGLWQVTCKRHLTEEELQEPIYIYEIADEGFIIVHPKSQEYFSLDEDVEPLHITQTTAAEILNEWKHEGTVELRYREPAEREIPSLSLGANT